MDLLKEPEKAEKLILEANKPIGLFLSMNYHVGIPDWIRHFDQVIFEDNGRETRHEKVLRRPWTDWFSQIKFVGIAKDHGMKSIYHLSK